MAHFAQLDENNVVTQVIVVNNNEIVDPTPVVIDGVMYTNGESESKGIEFCRSLFGSDTAWVQTSYNGSFRGKYAAIGDTYDAEANIFRSSVVVPSVDATVVEPVVETQQTVVVESQSIPALTSASIQTLESTQIPALNTADLQSLTTTGL